MLTTEPSEIPTNRQIYQNRDSATKVQITRPIGTPNHPTAPIEPKSVPTTTRERDSPRMNELSVISILIPILRARWDATSRNERGDVTEKVIIVAIFAALAIAAGAIIVSKVTAKANAIPTNSP